MQLGDMSVGALISFLGKFDRLIYSDLSNGHRQLWVDISPSRQAEFGRFC